MSVDECLVLNSHGAVQSIWIIFFCTLSQYENRKDEHYTRSSEYLHLHVYLART